MNHSFANVARSGVPDASAYPRPFDLPVRSMYPDSSSGAAPAQRKEGTIEADVIPMSIGLVVEPAPQLFSSAGPSSPLFSGPLLPLTPDSSPVPSSSPSEDQENAEDDGFEPVVHGKRKKGKKGKKGSAKESPPSMEVAADGPIPPRPMVSEVDEYGKKRMVKDPNRCGVCFHSSHDASSCRVICRLCEQKGHHLTQYCDVPEVGLYCIYCKENGHLVRNCHLAQSKKVADQLQAMGFCEKCSLYGHDHTKHGCTAPPCRYCDSILHHSKQCERCRDCREPGHTDSGHHVTDDGQVVIGCPNAPRCKWCPQREGANPIHHSYRFCPRRICAFCGDRGHTRGRQCPLNDWDSEWRQHHS